MKHNCHLGLSTLKFPAVVGDELIRNINTIHPMIVVVDNKWYIYLPPMFFPPYILKIVLVCRIQSWSSTICLNILSF